MLKAIYHPKLKRLTYWYFYGTSNHQHKVDDVTLPQAKAILRDSMVQSELVQELEIFNG